MYNSPIAAPDPLTGASPMPLSTRQINALYQEFVAGFYTDGVQVTQIEYKFYKFQEAKEAAINTLTGILAANHGRGDHTVKLYGVVYKDITTSEEYKVGFSINLQPQRDQLVFEL
jgi:hypothetical protein